MSHVAWDLHGGSLQKTQDLALHLPTHITIALCVLTVLLLYPPIALVLYRMMSSSFLLKVSVWGLLWFLSVSAKGVNEKDDVVTTITAATVTEKYTINKEPPSISEEETQKKKQRHDNNNNSNQQQQQRPNIIIILTDDLDARLGGWKASTLTTTRALIADQGMVIPNWFAQTPVCCPSRAELLSGKYFHNLWTTTRGGANDTDFSCMHVDVQSKKSSKFYQQDYFAKYFQRLNYTVGIFGKHLNSANPKNFIPEGVDAMLINNGGEYLNPTFTWATRDSTDPPQQVKFDNCTYWKRNGGNDNGNGNDIGEESTIDCYTTSIVGNASLAWIRRHITESTIQPSSFSEQHVYSNKENQQTIKPFFSLISVKAPHVQDGPGFPISIPAPWYKNTPITEQYAPRTLNYNQSCPDHHWLVRNQLPLTAEQATHIDELYQSRLRTLLSVDDLVRDLVSMLQELQVLDNTYIVFTSDNGYRLGQFRMPCCKLNPYEDDILLPMMIRGPGIVPFTTRNDIIGTHVDLMPTLLGLATAAATATTTTTDYNGHHDNDPTTTTIVDHNMDGINLANQFLQPTPSYPATRILCIEYKSLGNIVRYEHLVDTYNHTFVALRVLDTSAPVGFQNLKYVQYRDSRLDWNSTEPPLEQELFDLDLDPYEMNNLVVTGERTMSTTTTTTIARGGGGGERDSLVGRNVIASSDNNLAKDRFFLQGLSTILSRMMQCEGKGCFEEEENLKHYYAELVYQTLHYDTDALSA